MAAHRTRRRTTPERAITQAASRQARLEARTLQLLSLTPFDAPAFTGLTFPAYREVLAACPPEVEAVGLLAGDTPVGLGLGRLGVDGEAQLLSLLITRGHRNQGWGGRLLATLEARLVARGAHLATGTYDRGTASVEALERLLGRAGYGPPRPRMLLVRARYDDMRQAPWVGRVSLPEAFRLGLWADVPPEARAALARQQAEGGWIPEDLLPWRNEDGHATSLSRALWHDEAVVGWLLVHPLGAGALRYTCSYVHPAHQRRARLLPAYEAVMHDAAAQGLRDGIWTVPHRHPAMVAFARRWMAPHASSVSETVAVGRLLRDHPAAPGMEPTGVSGRA